MVEIVHVRHVVENTTYSPNLKHARGRIYHIFTQSNTHLVVLWTNPPRDNVEEVVGCVFIGRDFEPKHVEVRLEDA